MNKSEIIDRLYFTYGTGSGILFGIADRRIVDAIVDFTIEFSGVVSLQKALIDLAKVAAFTTKDLIAFDGAVDLDNAIDAATKVLNKTI